jgi:hypothetical protein
MYKKLIYSIVIALLLQTNAYTTEIAIVKAFYSKLSTRESKKIENLCNSDKFFKAGYGYLTNKEKMSKNKLANFYDKTKKKKTIVLPNHIKAIVEFEKSVLKYQNPLSAYLGLYSMNFLINAEGVNKTKRRKLFIETLYKNTDMCEGYIQYADMLMKGYGIKTDLNKSIKVLNSARKNCWDRANDLEKSIINVKETQAKYKIKLLKMKSKK